MELPKLDAKPANYENPLDRWAMFLKGWDNMELLERLSEEDPAIAQARKALEKMASDPRAKEIYEQRLKAIMDRNSDLYEAELKGLREGKREGIREGKKEGMREAKLETARNALLEGADIEFVAKITGLPLEIIQKLKAE
ncbi:MAG: Rpn family recombination-promoting nuclease/putative transposase [Syntrophothermaceae bacterium]